MRHLVIVILILLIVSSNTYGQGDFLHSGKTDTVFIKSILSRDTLILKPIDPVNQSNSGFDWKVWLPTFTALLVLLVTNLVTLYKIRKDTKEGIKKEIVVSKIKVERERLEKFYDPIFTAVKSNAAIFTSYGPHSFPKR